MKKSRSIPATSVAMIVLALGIVSLILAYNIILELIDLGWLQGAPIDEQTRETIDSKMADLLIEIIFAVGMITYGIIVLQRGSFKGKKKKPIMSKNRKLAYFQSQFGFGILVIAILISFSIQSMNDDREFFMIFWGVLAMVGFGYIVIYRDKKLQEIFDDDDYPLETKPKSEIKKKL